MEPHQIFIWFTLYLLAASLPAASNEAATCPDDCGPHGECVEEDATWSCRCNDPYTGPDCSIIRSDLSQDTDNDSWMLIVFALLLTGIGLTILALIAVIVVSYRRHNTVEFQHQGIAGLGLNPLTPSNHSRQQSESSTAGGGSAVTRNKNYIIASTTAPSKQDTTMATSSMKESSVTPQYSEQPRQVDTDNKLLLQPQTSQASGEDINTPNTQDTKENSTNGSMKDKENLQGAQKPGDPLFFGTKHIKLKTIALASTWASKKARQYDFSKKPTTSTYPKNDEITETTEVSDTEPDLEINTTETAGDDSPKMNPFKTKRRSLKTPGKKDSKTISIDDDAQIF